MSELDSLLKSVDESFTISDASRAAINEAAKQVSRGEQGFALSILSKAIMAEPENVPLRLQFAVLYEQVGEGKVAQEQYDIAVALAPKHPMVRRFNALNLMLSGDYDRGWPELRWREVAGTNKTFYHIFNKIPVWKGEVLDSKQAGPFRYKHILLWTEQGIGDELIMATMIPDVIKMTPEITLVVSDKMEPIFRRMFPSVQIYRRTDIASGERYPLGDIDYQASFSELGQYLRSKRTDFPRTTNLIRVDKDLARGLRKEYRKSSGNKPLIGISWKAPSSQFPDLKGSDLVKHWKHLLKYKDDYQFVSLQYGNLHDDVKKAENEFGIEIIEEGGFDAFTDIQTFANQIAALDLVISVSNSTVHIAGAMDKPVFTIVPNQCKLWYWGQYDRHTPWYPSMRLWRGEAEWAVADATSFLRNIKSHVFSDPIG